MFQDRSKQADDIDSKSKEEISEINRILSQVKRAESLESLVSVVENEVRPQTMLIKGTDVAIKSHFTSP